MARFGDEEFQELWDHIPGTEFFDTQERNDAMDLFLDAFGPTDLSPEERQDAREEFFEWMGIDDYDFPWEDWREWMGYGGD